MLRIACEGRTTLLGQSGKLSIKPFLKAVKIGCVKKTDERKSRREMNKGTGFRPKNELSLLCNGKGGGELTGSKFLKRDGAPLCRLCF